ncbi:MAG: hypothetical protein ACKOED_13990 [Aestuariivirga sp.]|uniref:hypothetical protein n=1 Tax=Aestuariivirga sp. TaxID=2650926 RepID=UPI0038D07D88
MQYQFSCISSTYIEIEKTISVQRIGRYFAEAKGDKNRALRLYVWNASICESFYLPNQLLEVAIRNRLHVVLAAHFGQNWHVNNSFVSPLPNRLQTGITNAIRDCTRDHGAGMTINHIVGSLSLGFWNHLLTSNFDTILWSNGMTAAFPYVPNGMSRQNIYDRVDQFRNWRNRIAHHGAIFDKRPMRELKNIQEIMSWVCPHTLWFMNEINSVHRVLGRKPVR